MKYIKSINEYKISQDDLEDIKDVFQELVDQYDLIDGSSLGEEDINEFPGIYYCYFQDRSDIGNIELHIRANYDKVNNYLRSFISLCDDLPGFMKTLDSMGYSVSCDKNPSKIVFNTYQSSYFIITISSNNI